MFSDLDEFLEFGDESSQFLAGGCVLLFGWDDGHEELVVLDSACHGVLDVFEGLGGAFQVVAGELDGLNQGLGEEASAFRGIDKALDDVSGHWVGELIEELGFGFG